MRWRLMMRWMTMIISETGSDDFCFQLASIIRLPYMSVRVIAIHLITLQLQGY